MAYDGSGAPFFRVFALSALLALALTVFASGAQAATVFTKKETFGPNGTFATTFNGLGGLAFDQSKKRLYAFDQNAKLVYALDLSLPGAVSSVGGGFPLTVETQGVLASIGVDNSSTASKGRFYTTRSEGSSKVFAYEPTPTVLGAPYPILAPGSTSFAGVDVDSAGNLAAANSQSGVAARNVRLYDNTGAALTPISLASQKNGASRVAFDSNDDLYVGMAIAGGGGAATGVWKFTKASGYTTSTLISDTNFARGLVVDKTNHHLFWLEPDLPRWRPTADRVDQRVRPERRTRQRIRQRGRLEHRQHRDQRNDPRRLPRRLQPEKNRRLRERHRSDPVHRRRRRGLDVRRDPARDRQPEREPGHRLPLRVHDGRLLPGKRLRQRRDGKLRFKPRLRELQRQRRGDGRRAGQRQGLQVPADRGELNRLVAARGDSRIHDTRPKGGRSELPNLSNTSATLKATINPNGSGTVYRFQYVDQASFEASGFLTASEMPLSPAAIGSGTADIELSQVLTGLQPNTGYFFRAAATNGDAATFGKAAFLRTEEYTADTCPNAELRVGPSAELPDCRAYEQATPTDKAGFEMYIFKTIASPDGSAATSSAAGAFGDQRAALLENMYASHRSAPGLWHTFGLNPPAALDTELSHTIMWGVSADLSKQFNLTRSVLGIGAEEGQNNLYLHDTNTGTDQFIATDPPGKSLCCNIEYIGGTDDGTHTFFSATANLDSTPAPTGGGRQVYDFDHGVLKLVNVMPDDATPTSSGSATIQPTATSFSEDGRRIYWKSNTGELYLREDGHSTALGAGNTANFVGMSKDGAIAFFTSSNKVTVDASPTGIDLAGTT